jgi:hypothetical protein
VNPTHKVDVVLHDGTEVYGQLMYLIVWEGKSLSGSETLVRGEDIKTISTKACICYTITEDNCPVHG